MLTKEEFFQKHKKVIETGLITEEYVDDMLEMILEMSISEQRALSSQIERIFMHMLKYEYQKERQSRSWINTIRNARSEISSYKESHKSVWNSFGDDHLDDIYKRALSSAAAETNIPKKYFPDLRPPHFTKDNIADSEFIEKYLRSNAYSEYAKKELF